MDNIQEAYRLQAAQKFFELSENLKEELQGLTELAAEICNTPIALLTIVDQNKQYFLGTVGTDLSETARDISFCTHTIEQKDIFMINDTWKDERFAFNPLVTGALHIRFYAGATITTDDGYNIGSICVIDQQPRVLNARQKKALSSLSQQASRLMELNLTLKLTSHLLETQESMEMKLRSILDSSPANHVLVGRNYEILAFNKAANQFITNALGRPYVYGDNVLDYATPSSIDIFIECYQKALQGEHIFAERQVNYYNIPTSWWEITYTPAYNSKGEILGVAFNALNIDERKKQEEQVKQQHLKLKQIAQLQSHQVRGPLTSIIGLIQIIKEEHFSCDEEMYNLLNRAAQQLDDNIRAVVSATTHL